MAIVAKPAQALPTFHVSIDGAQAASPSGKDETWFSASNPFTLIVVGAYTGNTQSLTNVTLRVSVPENSVGDLSFSDLGDGTPSLLKVGNGTNPIGNANQHVLTSVVGNNGYDKNDDFRTGLNNHDPTHDDVSDFVLFNLGSFSNTEHNLNNYDASTGTITPAANSFGKRNDASCR